MVLLRHAFYSLWDSSMSTCAALVHLFSLLCEVTMCEYANIVTPFSWWWIFRLFLIVCYEQCHHEPSCAYPPGHMCRKGSSGYRKHVSSASRDDCLTALHSRPSIDTVTLWEFQLLGGVSNPLSLLPRMHTPLLPVPNECLIFLRAQLWIWKVCYILSCISACFSKVDFLFLWLLFLSILCVFFKHS